MILRFAAMSVDIFHMIIKISTDNFPNIFNWSVFWVETHCVLSLGEIRYKMWLLVFNLFLAWHNSPSGPRPLNCWGLEITLKTHHTRWDSSGRVISPTRRHLPDNTTLLADTSMLPAWFEPTIPACERPLTHTLETRGHWGRLLTFLLNPWVFHHVACNYIITTKWKFQSHETACILV
jgi:hypothetical protein